MSAAKFSRTTRIAHDNYPTPAWCVRRLLEACPLPGGVWLEPCAGEGAIIRAVRDWRLSESLPAAHRLFNEPIFWGACEVRDVPALDGVAWHYGSYLDVSYSNADVIISNPPFSLAERIVKKALTEAPWVAMLLSLLFVKCAKRAAWLRECPPDRYDIPQPVTFVQCLSCAATPACGWEASELPGVACPTVCPGCGGKVRRSAGDMVGYGWYVWTPDRARTQGKYTVLPVTPLDERKRAA